MTTRIILLILLTLLTTEGISQTNKNVSRTLDYYFEQIAKLEIAELISQGVLLDSSTIAEEFKDSNGKLNDEGFMKYGDIKESIYLSFFKDYLFMQKLESKNNVYVLYFTMAGFDDIEWNIFRWDQDDWKNEERLSQEIAAKDSLVTKILWNYDEGPKNIENIRIFIKNDFLVMERGNLYHSLYDLRTEKVIINEESPWHASNGEGKERMNEWIKSNLHDKIEIILDEQRK